MTYQQVKYLAFFKRILGWIIFVLALVSTLISLLNFIYSHSEKHAGITAVILDFLHVMVKMVRFNTGFLNLFWFNSPTPELNNSILSHNNVMFIVIYLFIFVGLALQASGARMSRQVRYVREYLEVQVILERAKGNEKLTRNDLEQRISLKNQSLFLQYFPLYILPIVFGLAIYVILHLLVTIVGNT